MIWAARSKADSDSGAGGTLLSLFLELLRLLAWASHLETKAHPISHIKV